MKFVIHVWGTLKNIFEYRDIADSFCGKKWQPVSNKAVINSNVNADVIIIGAEKVIDLYNKHPFTIFSTSNHAKNYYWWWG